MKVQVDTKKLETICSMSIESFMRFGTRMTTPGGNYFFRDNGQSILGVAHLDTVLPDSWREEAAKVYTPALDDRLGVYVLIHLLPSLGVEFDLLLTDGEERGQSTAMYFKPPRQYNWIFSFDRAGTDVVMYQYGTVGHGRMLEDCGFRVGVGIFSDIAFLEHLGCKGFNFGCGYHDKHSTNCHAILNETEEMVRKFVLFHQCYANKLMPHPPSKPLWQLREEMLNRPYSDI